MKIKRYPMCTCYFCSFSLPTVCFYIPFAVFQRLANDKFCERNRCIVITVTPDPASSVIVT
jgi:hypothetical protein